MNVDEQLSNQMEPDVLVESSLRIQKDGLRQLPNPYDFANPVTDELRFAGREKELEDIDYYLAHAEKTMKPIHLALIGDRASGKTSLLNMIEVRAQKYGFAVARIDLDETDIQAELPFFQRILGSIINAVCEVGALGGSRGALYESYRLMIDTLSIPEDPIHHVFRSPLQFVRAMQNDRSTASLAIEDFLHDLKLIQSKFEKPIIILFDECDVLSRSRMHLQKLRNIFQRTTGFMIAMAGTPLLFPVMDDVFSPIIRQYKKINLAPFESSQETQACIRQPLVGTGSQDANAIWQFMTADEVRDIHEVSGGRPYEIQLLCHFMFKRLESGEVDRLKISLEVLDDVQAEIAATQDLSQRPLVKAVRGYGKSEIVALGRIGACCDHATIGEMWFAHYVFDADLPSSLQTMEVQLNRFIADGVLKLVDGNICFCGDDFDRIYCKYYALTLGIVRTVESRTFEQFLLNQLIDLIDEVAPELFVIQIETGSKETVRERQGAIFELDWSRDPWAENARAARVAYRRAFEASEDGPNRIISVNLAASGKFLSIWFEPVDGENLATLELTEALDEVSRRALELGGDLSVEDLSIPIPDRQTLLNSVLTTERTRIRTEMADFHANIAVEAYSEERDLATAEFHADYAAQYFGDKAPPLLANNLGYIFLASGNLDRCQSLFEREIAIGNRILGQYNLAITWAMRGQAGRAISELIELLSIADPEEDTQEMLCLFVPIAQEILRAIEFEEVIEPELLQTARDAIVALSRYNSWLDS